MTSINRHRVINLRIYIESAPPTFAAVLLRDPSVADQMVLLYPQKRRLYEATSEILCPKSSIKSMSRAVTIPSNRPPNFPESEMYLGIMFPVNQMKLDDKKGFSPVQAAKYRYDILLHRISLL